MFARVARATNLTMHDDEIFVDICVCQFDKKQNIYNAHIQLHVICIYSTSKDRTTFYRISMCILYSIQYYTVQRIQS